MKNTHFSVPAWVEQILIPDEKIVWEGKPVFGSLLLTELLNSAKAITFILALAAIWFIATHYFELGSDFDIFRKDIVGIFIIFLVLPSVYNIIKKIVEYRTIEYCITNKRIISYTGVFTKTYTVVEFAQLTQVGVKRNIIDNRYNTGTILFKTAVTEYNHKDEPEMLYCQFESVENPFDAIRFVPQDKVAD